MEMRPKVINIFNTDTYSSKFPQLNIVNEMTAFIQVYAYDVSIPIAGIENDFLNIFERSVLRLIRYGISSVAAAADELCIDKDMCSFIFSRLRELDLINNNNSLTDSGQKYLDLGHGKKLNKNLMAKVFSLKPNDKFLSYIWPEGSVWENAWFDGNKRDTIVISSGTTGKSRQIKGKVLYDKSGIRERAMPNQTVLKKIIKEYNRICYANGMEKIEYPDNSMIEVSFQPQRVFMLIKIAIQEGNIENILVSDGFMMNNGMILEEVVNNDPEIKKSLFEVSSVTSIDEGGASRNDDLIKKYPEIYECMPQEIDTSTNIDEDNAQKDAKWNNVRKMLLAVEYALNYYLKRNNLPESILKLLKSRSSAEIGELIGSYLENMGAVIKKEHFELISHTDRYSINRFKKGEAPDICTVLPLAAAHAYECTESTFMDMIKNMPDFMSGLLMLKRNSASSRHTVNSEQIPEELYSRMKAFTLSFISYILPDFDTSFKKNKRSNGLSFNQKNLNAVNALYNDLGSKNYEMLKTEIRHELWLTSSDKKLKDLPIPSEIILSFCKVIQMLMSELCAETNVENCTKKQALDMIRHYSGEEPPKVLETVNDIFFRNAAENNASTLGAVVLVYLSKADCQKAEEFISRSYHKFIAELLELRGHGNNIGLVLNESKILYLRSRLYELIRFLGE